MWDQPEYELFTYVVRQTGKGPGLEFRRDKKVVKTLPYPAGMQCSLQGTAWVLIKGFELASFIEIPSDGILFGVIVAITEEIVKFQLSDSRTTEFPMRWVSSDMQIHIGDKAWVNIQNKIFLQPPEKEKPLCKTDDQSVSTVSHPHPQVLATQSSLGQSVQSTAPPLAENPHFNITEEEKAAFHSLSRESERNEEIFDTIGRHRLPITMLSRIFKWNPVMVTTFEGLFGSYGAWRRSRGDGNCFYRCLGILYLEHLFRASTSIAEARQFYSQIMGHQNHFVQSAQIDEGDKGVNTFCNMIKDLHNLKLTGRNALQTLQYYVQKPAIDRSLIVALRTYIASYLWLHQGDEDICPSLGNAEQLYTEIFRYGEEAEGLALKLAARALNVILYIQTVNTKSTSVSIIKYGPDQLGWYPVLHMLHMSRHFYCLIPRDVHESDHYDFEANTYSGQAGERIIGYEQFVPETLRKDVLIQ